MSALEMHLSYQWRLNCYGIINQ